MKRVAFKTKGGRVVSFKTRATKRPAAPRADPVALPALRFFNPWTKKPGKRGRYAPKLRAAWSGVSGVYVIRSASGRRRVLYVGESHTGALGDTCTRHLRVWSGETCTFRTEREAVEVALVRTAPAAAKKLETRLIRALKPKEQGKGTGCDSPF